MAGSTEFPSEHESQSRSGASVDSSARPDAIVVSSRPTLSFALLLTSLLFQTIPYVLAVVDIEGVKDQLIRLCSSGAFGASQVRAKNTFIRDMSVASIAEKLPADADIKAFAKDVADKSFRDKDVQHLLATKADVWAGALERFVAECFDRDMHVILLPEQ